MLLGDARTMDERGLDIEKTEHRVPDSERIRDERTANRRGARIQAFGRGQIRESEDRHLLPPIAQKILDSTMKHVGLLLLAVYHASS